jgi:hypothetical protein
VLGLIYVTNHREGVYEKDRNRLEMNTVLLKEETLFLKLFFLWDYQYEDRVNDQAIQLNEEMGFCQGLFGLNQSS